MRQIENKMVDLHTAMSIMALKANDINTPIKKIFSLSKKKIKTQLSAILFKIFIYLLTWLHHILVSTWKPLVAACGI